MNHTTGDSFLAYIPQQPDNTDIFYYLHAEDDSDRSENHPYIGEGNPHHFFMGPDIIPPTIATEIPESLLPFSLPSTITADVRDNRWIASVSLEYLINGVPIDTLEMLLQPLSAVIYETELNPEVIPGDLIQLRIKAIDNSTNQNTTFAPVTGYYTIQVVGNVRACVWNPCAQPSGQAIFDYLQRWGIDCYYTEEEPVSFNRFGEMFICLGSWPCTYALNLAQVNKITSYIQSGHCVYAEGTDCWAYDPFHTQLSQVFGIIGIWDGPIVQSINPLLGQAGTFTSGMSFNSSNAHYVDRLAPAPGSETILTHADTAFGVVHETTTYKTLGLSMELGSLSGNNTSSSQAVLLRQILRYFQGFIPEIAELEEKDTDVKTATQFRLNAIYPNPFNSSVALRFELSDASSYELTIYDINGREVWRLETRDSRLETNEVVWDAEGMPSGIYFAQLSVDGGQSMVRKVVLMK
jgi:hypothetical protein